MKKFLCGVIGLAALCTTQAQAGLVVGSSANLVATDNFFPAVFIDESELVGAATQFSGTQNLGGIILDWSARLDANTVTISLTTSQGGAVFGTPRETFAFTGLTVDPGTNLGGLSLLSESNFNAVVESTGANSITVGINSFDTRSGVLTATATFAIPQVPEPASGILFGTMLLGFNFLRRGSRGGSKS